MWLETDRVYRAAAERLIKIKTNQQVKAADRDKSNDFSSEELCALGSASTVTLDTARWNEDIRGLSKSFLKYPDLLSSEVEISVQSDNRYFVNTEEPRFSTAVISPRDDFRHCQDQGWHGCFGLRVFRRRDPKNLPSKDALAAASKELAITWRH